MVEPGEFSLDESLIDQGVIDSFGLVESAAFMEREFKIKIAETDMNRANFGSVKKMVVFVSHKRTK
jgi:acyl carrier protein